MRLLPATVLFTVLLSAGVQADEPINYCNDPQAAREWARLLAEAPHDPLVLKLFALRVGLCQLVVQRLLSVEQATLIFEAERSEAIHERQWDGRENNPALPGT